MFGGFTIGALQLWEPLNILSFTVSFVSLLYGIGNYVVLKSQDFDNFEVDFSMTVWGVLANMIDAGLRVLFFAYISTIIKGYIFLILLAYVLVVLIILVHQVKHFMVQKGYFMTYLSEMTGPAMQSLPCSGIETSITLKEDKCRLRTISKSVFSCLFLISLIFVGISTNSDNFNGIGYALKNSSHIPNENIIKKHCTNICKSELIRQAQNEPLNGPSNATPNEWNKICLESWKHLGKSYHLTAQIVLIVLFCLSLLEWVLENCYDCMPYNAFHSKKIAELDRIEADPELAQIEADLAALNLG